MPNFIGKYISSFMFVILLGSNIFSYTAIVHADDPHMVIDLYAAKDNDRATPVTTFTPGATIAVVARAKMSSDSMTIKDRYTNGIISGQISILVPKNIVNSSRPSSDKGFTVSGFTSSSLTIRYQTHEYPPDTNKWLVTATFNAKNEGLKNTVDPYVNILYFKFQIPSTLAEGVNDKNHIISLAGTDELINIETGTPENPKRLYINNGDLEIKPPISIALGNAPSTGELPSIIYGLYDCVNYDANNNMTITISYNPVDSQPSTANFLYTVYDENSNMTKYASMTVDVPANEDKIIINNIETYFKTIKDINIGNIGEAYRIDGFLWSDTNEMVPLGKSKYIWYLSNLQ